MTLRTRAMAAILGSASMAWTAPALAAESSIRLTFVGTPGCNDEPALRREVESRAPAIRFTDAGDAATSISVRIVSAGERVHSIVFIERTGHPAATRAITGRDCQELLEGTALVIAVVIPREKQGNPAPALPPEESVGLPPKPGNPGLSDESAWRVGGGAAGTLIQGVAPGAMPGVEGFLDTQSTRTGWAPAFRLGFRYAARSGFSAGEAQAAFGLASGFAAACPAAWLAARVFALRPCATTSFGSLEATGSNVDDGRSERHPFAAAGIALRLDVRFAAPLSLEFETGAEVALTESTFRFGDAAFHETAPVTGRLALGVSVHAP